MPSHKTSLAILPPEQQRIRDTCYYPRGTFVPFPMEAIEQSIPERFEEMVWLYPDRLAVQDAHESLTYAELNQAANQVAQAILARRGRVAEPVAILVEQNAATIAAMLGVLKSGKFYVVLEPTLPPTRMASMFKDSRADLVLTDTSMSAVAQELTRRGGQFLNIAQPRYSRSKGGGGPGG